MLPFGTQLSQVRPAGTSAVNAFGSRKREEMTITHVLVANVTGNTVYYSLYHDDDGATFNQTTALYYQIEIPANTTDSYEFGSAESGLILSKDGEVGVQTDTGDAIVFSLYGISGVRT